MKSSRLCFSIPLFIMAICIISFSSCTQEDVCAKCIESHTLYQPDDFCGDPDDVDDYVELLKKEGAQVGQDWVCIIE